MKAGTEVRVIFLDVDGVLNSHDWFRRRTSRKHDTDNDIDPDAALRIQRLCEETGSSICVSSTWRILNTPAKLRDAFLAKGITAEVLGVTPRVQHLQRGDEIQAWLDETKRNGYFEVKGMVIIDDDSDMSHLRPWLVKTPFETGFVEEHIEAAKSMLNSPMPSIVK